MEWYGAPGGEYSPLAEAGATNQPGSDPEAVGRDEYTVFDDESGGDLLRFSRVVTVRIDPATRVATLIRSDDQPEGQVAQLMGNAQSTPSADLFIVSVGS